MKKHYNLYYLLREDQERKRPKSELKQRIFAALQHPPRIDNHQNKTYNTSR